MDVPKWQRIRDRLDEYTERNGDFFFVQIGANDGEEVDPIREHVTGGDWRGLLVEPVPHLFERLVGNYDGYDDLDFANVAVTDHNGSATMLAATELDDGKENPARLISSLDPDVVHKHRWLLGPLEGFVSPTEVEAMTLRTLVATYGISHIDGLFVDTEGHDKVVLDQLGDLPFGLPRFVLYEHAHLSRPDRRELAADLEGRGYEITDLRKDTFAELSPAAG